MVEAFQNSLPVSRTRERLLDAGRTLFCAQGYAATSMRQIADTAGLALGGIYNHFVSKEAIFQAILIEDSPLKRLITEPLPDPEDWFEVKKILIELENEPEFIHLILLELLEFQGVHLPELFKAIPDGFPFSLPWRMVLSLMVSYHVTHILLADKTSPEGQRQASLDTFLDELLICIKKPE